MMDSQPASQPARMMDSQPASWPARQPTSKPASHSLVNHDVLGDDAVFRDDIVELDTSLVWEVVGSEREGGGQGH